MYRVVWSEGTLQMHHDKEWELLSDAMRFACDLLLYVGHERDTVAVYDITKDRKPHENVGVIMLMMFLSGAWHSAYSAPLPRSRHKG